MSRKTARERWRTGVRSPAPIASAPVLSLVAVVGVVVIAVLGLIGGLGIAGVSPFVGWRLFDLDGEATVPASVSALLLFGAAVASCLLARRLSSRTSVVVFVTLALFFTGMALDELLSIHERLELRTGVDWQTLYLPLFVIGAGSWVVAALRLRPSSARLAWLAGGACWAVAQLLEYLQWDGDRLLHRWMFIPEEVLEMIGSLMFVLALLAAICAPRCAMAPRKPVDAPLERAKEHRRRRAR